MSQQKVEQNKELKKNRRKTIQQDKVKSFLATAVAGICICVIAGWLAFSVYGKMEDSRIAKRRTISTEINLDPIMDYLSSLPPVDGEEAE